MEHNQKVTFLSEDCEGNIIQVTRQHDDCNAYYDGSIEALLAQFREFLLAEGYTQATINEFITIIDA